MVYCRTKTEVRERKLILQIVTSRDIYWPTRLESRVPREDELRSLNKQICHKFADMKKLGCLRHHVSIWPLSNQTTNFFFSRKTQNVTKNAVNLPMYVPNEHNFNPSISQTTHKVSQELWFTTIIYGRLPNGK